MKPQLYELLWELCTDVGEFYYREIKVFHSDAKARSYGKRRERELNDGLSIERRAQDGFFFKYRFATQIEEVDGYPIHLVDGVR
jgi:hypothetical protein